MSKGVVLCLCSIRSKLELTLVCIHKTPSGPVRSHWLLYARFRCFGGQQTLRIVKCLPSTPLLGPNSTAKNCPPKSRVSSGCERAPLTSTKDTSCQCTQADNALANIWHLINTGRGRSAVPLQPFIVNARVCAATVIASSAMRCLCDASTIFLDAGGSSPRIVDECIGLGALQDEPETCETRPPSDLWAAQWQVRLVFYCSGCS